MQTTCPYVTSVLLSVGILCLHMKKMVSVVVASWQIFAPNNEPCVLVLGVLHKVAILK
jgi:hypothetical protein